MVPGPEETIRSDDYHTAGEPFRIVDAGPMEGTTGLERRSWASEHLDDLRRFLVGEPRGHADMYGGFVVPGVKSSPIVSGRRTRPSRHGLNK
mgnify:CR=1 FL=1